MRAKSFEVQTAQRYVENLIIDFAADALHVHHTPAPPISVTTSDDLRGAQFVFEVDEGCEGDTNAVTFEWNSKLSPSPITSSILIG